MQIYTKKNGLVGYSLSKLIFNLILSDKNESCFPSLKAIKKKKKLYNFII